MYLLPVGGTPRLIQTGVANLPESWPMYSSDGQWVYFQSGAGDGYGTRELWRVHEDGSGRVGLGLPPLPGYEDIYPSPSPDGSQVAFATDRRTGYNSGVWDLAILTLADTTVRYLGVHGLTPLGSASAIGPEQPVTVTIEDGRST